MQPDIKRMIGGLKKDINVYKKLSRISRSQELDDFLDLLLKTAADKMVWAFIGNNIKNWDEFVQARAEITSYMYPIQEVRGADTMRKELETRLKSYYDQPE